MNDARMRESLWHDTRLAPTYPPLDRDLRTEVLVIGAGLVGASVAWELTRAGRDVVLLDSSGVGGGATAATIANFSALQGTTYSRIVRSAGRAAAREYAGLQTMAVHHLVSITERLGIDCGLRRRPCWLFAETGAGVDALEREAELATDAGLRLERGMPGLPFPVKAAVSAPDQVLLHPLAYVDAVVADAAVHGARVHEHTGVRELDTGAVAVAHLDTGGTVRADHAVLATQLPTLAAGPELAELAIRREYILAGRLPGGLRLPDMYVGTDAEVRALRSAGRQLLVSGGQFASGEADPATRLLDLERWAEDRVPGFEIARTWTARDVVTPDRLPVIGRLRPGAPGRSTLWGATGFSDWGMASGVLAGVLLRKAIADGEEPPEVFAPGRLGRRTVLRSAAPRTPAQASSGLVPGASG